VRRRASEGLAGSLQGAAHVYRFQRRGAVLVRTAQVGRVGLQRVLRRADEAAAAAVRLAAFALLALPTGGGLAEDVGGEDPEIPPRTTVEGVTGGSSLAASWLIVPHALPLHACDVLGGRSLGSADWTSHGAARSLLRTAEAVGRICTAGPLALDLVRVVLSNHRRRALLGRASAIIVAALVDIVIRAIAPFAGDVLGVRPFEETCRAGISVAGRDFVAAPINVFRS